MCLSLSSGVSLRCLILCWERVCSLSVSLPGCSCLVTAISSPLLPWGCSWGHAGWYLTRSFRIHVHRQNPVSNQDSGAVDSSPISVFLSATTGHLPHGSGGGERLSPTSTAGALCPPVSNVSRAPAAPEEQPKLPSPGARPSPSVGCGWLGPGGQAKCCRNKTELK